MARTITVKEILDTRRACYERNAFPDVKLYLEHVEALLVARGSLSEEVASGILEQPQVAHVEPVEPVVADEEEE